MCLAMLSLAMPGAALAQRELRWDSIEVSAHLGAAGELHVTETQTMVFTGDWNGGERRFTIHPRQKLSFAGLYRAGPGAVAAADGGFKTGRRRRLCVDQRQDASMAKPAGF